MLNWYVLYTKPHCEHQVEQALRASEIETFFPVMPVPARRGRSAFKPYFPCYLFAQVNLDAVGISRLNWMPGMRYVVQFGGKPARMDARVVAKIREHLARPQALDEHGEMLEPGDRVVITAEPLREVEAIFDKRLSATGRVRVLIQMLRRWNVIELEAQQVRKVSRAIPVGRVQPSTHLNAPRYS